MSAHAAIHPQWPANVVRVTYAPGGVRLHFPALRGWRHALRLALFGAALFVPSLFAMIAYAPSDQPDAAAILTLALTAAVVFPVLLFGALFVLVALYAVANSLTVDVDATAIRAVRRVLGMAIGTQTMPVTAIRALETKTAIAPRGLGGYRFYRLVVTAADPAANDTRSMIVADGMADETLLVAVKALIMRYAQFDRAQPAGRISCEGQMANGK